MAIDPKYVVTLQGREYPLWAGVLGEAHERGLQSIETELIQIPSADNDHTAIVRAVVVMKDGSTFADYGDASPRNTSAKLANAIIRLASTRAKGRAVRDAINVGQTLFEELPDLEEEKGRPASRSGNRRDVNPSRYGEEADEAVTAAAERGRERMATGAQTGAAVCSAPGCGVVLKPAVVTFSEKRFGKRLCMDHQKQVTA